MIRVLTRGSRKPLVPGNDLGRPRIAPVVRRHDLHHVLVERVLDVRVQLVEHEQARMRVFEAHEVRFEREPRGLSLLR